MEVENMRTWIVAALAALLVTLPALALDIPVVASPTPATVSVPIQVLAAGAVVVSPSDFFSEVVIAIQKFGGAPTMLKIALIILLIVSSMKVTVINKWVWSKLGAAQTWIAPLLGLVAGLLDLAGSGQLTLASLAAYMSAGAGAIILHELLDGLKTIPGIGPVWLTLIAFLEKKLGGPAAQPVPVPVEEKPVV